MAQLLAQTPSWLVFNKPAGWLTIPGRAQPGIPVLSEWVQEHYGQAWVVHRLDIETSGVILFARSAEAHRLANGWFSKHRIRKRYHCLCSSGDSGGAGPSPVFRLDQPIEGVRSVTQVEVRERFACGAFLAWVQPVTGRRHQIRIHLSGVGFPLLGDPRYGGASVAGGISIPRVALHAARLELPAVPEAGEQRIFEAPWPGDFAAWVERLRSSNATR